MSFIENELSLAPNEASHYKLHRKQKDCLKYFSVIEEDMALEIVSISSCRRRDIIATISGCLSAYDPREYDFGHYQHPTVGGSHFC